MNSFRLCTFRRTTKEILRFSRYIIPGHTCFYLVPKMVQWNCIIWFMWYLRYFFTKKSRKCLEIHSDDTHIFVFLKLSQILAFISDCHPNQFLPSLQNHATFPSIPPSMSSSWYETAWGQGWINPCTLTGGVGKSSWIPFGSLWKPLGD